MTKERSVKNVAQSRFVPLVLAILWTFGLQSQTAPRRAFDSADDAARSLVDAAEKYDVPALLAILGPGADDLVASDDPVKDKERAQSFAQSAREQQSVLMDQKRTRAEVIVGADEWPLPIPIVNRKGKWYFDARAGRQEILFRRVGENELNAIQVCRGFVEAQLDYAA